GADHPDLFNNLAYLEAEMGTDLDAALALAQRALSLAPANPNYADTVGFVYLKKRETVSARRVFQTLSERHPDNARFRYHLALALLQSGDRTQGLRQLSAAIASDPSLANDPKVNDLLQERGTRSLH